MKPDQYNVFKSDKIINQNDSKVNESKKMIKVREKSLLNAPSQRNAISERKSYIMRGKTYNQKLEAK